jgi:hypothetical protein
LFSRSIIGCLSARLSACVPKVPLSAGRFACKARRPAPRCPSRPCRSLSRRGAVSQLPFPLIHQRQVKAVLRGDLRHRLLSLQRHFRLEYRSMIPAGLAHRRLIFSRGFEIRSRAKPSVQFLGTSSLLTKADLCLRSGSGARPDGTHVGARNPDDVGAALKTLKEGFCRKATPGQGFVSVRHFTTCPVCTFGSWSP